MKAAGFALLVFLSIPSLGLAAQLYGTLRESDKPVGPNIRVEAVCGSSTYPAVTDNYGSYKLFAREIGKCALRVYYKNQVPQITIDSYNDPTHYDFDLIRQPDGHYQLRRK
jgi:hypothetical protein